MLVNKFANILYSYLWNIRIKQKIFLKYKGIIKKLKIVNIMKMICLNKN